MNNRDIELYEPSKILGDVFEALIGAIFIDGGIEEVIRVYQHLLAPFILYVAKFSKRLNKEPKEDFTILAGLHKIVPQIINRGECELLHAQIAKFLEQSNSESLQPFDDEDVTMIDEGQKLKTSHQGVQSIMKVKMIRCDVLFNHNELMCTGFGNSKK